MKRILIVHTGGIGDFLLTCPALAFLAQNARLELVGKPDRLALAGDLAMAIHDIDAIDFHTLFTDPSPKLLDFLAPFDQALLWMRDDGSLRSQLQRCGIAQVECFPGLPPQNTSQHASEYYLGCVGAPKHFPWRLQVRAADEAYDVIIHPGSGGRHKNWPLDRFIDVAQTLKTQGHDVLWSRGPAEENFAFPETLPCLPSQSLISLAGVLSKANLYIGNDSGVSHLAACVGCPTIAIFGPTPARLWAPRGPTFGSIKLVKTFKAQQVNKVFRTEVLYLGAS